MDYDYHKSTTALFIHNHRELAKGLHSKFIANAKDLEGKVMAAEEIGALGRPNLYFAYGSNINSNQMKKRCPSAERIGVAILYDWKLEFSVYAPHRRAYTSGIRESDGDLVWGVLYAVSDEEKAFLDRVEHPGYSSRDVNVKLIDSQQPTDAVAYVPKTSNDKTTGSGNPDKRYLEAMIQGAAENDMQELLAYLHDVQKTT